MYIFKFDLDYTVGLLRYKCEELKASRHFGDVFYCCMDDVPDFLMEMCIGAIELDFNVDIGCNKTDNGYTFVISK